MEDGQEVGMYEIKNEGMPVLLKTNNKQLFYSFGISIVKLSLPTFDVVFYTETNHQDSIIDFTVSPRTVVST